MTRAAQPHVSPRGISAPGVARATRLAHVALRALCVLRCNMLRPRCLRAPRRLAQVALRHSSPL
eukprot:15307764-Alexandrium_andersonii.AAC.1